jgi:hypothetical protein
MTEYRQSHLRGTSTSSPNVTALLSGHFDVMVLFPSWDARSICVVQADNLTADKSIIVEFMLTAATD